jgi:hypothetical protein
VLPTMPDNWRPPDPLSKSENAMFPTEDRKAVPTTLWTALDLLPQSTQRNSISYFACLQESLVSLV